MAASGRSISAPCNRSISGGDPGAANCQRPAPFDRGVIKVSRSGGSATRCFGQPMVIPTTTRPPYLERSNLSASEEFGTITQPSIRAGLPLRFGAARSEG
jgi:hypothetical protein